MSQPDDCRAEVDSLPALGSEVVGLLRAAGATVAVAESLTGGMVGAAFTEVPGASAVFRGGITTYATDLKAWLLDVDDELLARHGPVHPEVAIAMAHGVRQGLASTYALATTGVAGPGPLGDQPVGTVHVALVAPGGEQVRSCRFDGDRLAVREQAVVVAMTLLRDAVQTGTPR